MPSSGLGAWLVVADGDDVGLMLDALSVANDEQGLLLASRRIDDIRRGLGAWFEQRGSTVLLSVADTVIAKGEGPIPALTEIPATELTWSIGLGRDLASAHAALAVAKASGKDRCIDGRAWEIGAARQTGPPH